MDYVLELHVFSSIGFYFDRRQIGSHVLLTLWEKGDLPISPSISLFSLKTLLPANKLENLFFLEMTDNKNVRENSGETTFRS